MKKIFSLATVVAASLMMGSCGFGSSSTTSQDALTSVATSALTGALTGNSGTSTSSTNSLLSTGVNLLSSLLGGSTASTSTIVGTWSYVQPEITFESSNVLANLGGQVAGTKLKTALGNQLQKIGLKAGVSTFTFNEDGTLKVTASTKTTTGKYTLSGNTLTMTGALGLTTIKATVSIQNNQLYLLFDSSAILGALTKLGQSNSTISSLLGNYTGMKLGWSMSK